MSIIKPTLNFKTFYNRFTEEAPMMSVSITLEKIGSEELYTDISKRSLPILLKEPVTGAFVWKSTIRR